MKPFLMTALFMLASSQAQEVHPTVLSAAGGRYVFGQVNSIRSDQYLLDTQTGKLWVIRAVKEQPVLQEVLFATTDAAGEVVYLGEPQKSNIPPKTSK